MRIDAKLDMKDFCMMHYFLGMKVCIWNLPWTREGCNGDPEKVRDDGLQGHDHTYGIEPEAIECCFIRFG